MKVERMASPKCGNCNNTNDTGSFAVKCSITDQWETEGGCCNQHSLIQSYHKEQTKLSAPSDDLKQYMTNLLYYAAKEANGMDGKEFDKWVEEHMNGIDEFFKSHLKQSVKDQANIPSLSEIREAGCINPNMEGYTDANFERGACYVLDWLKSHLEQSVKEEEKLK